MHRVLIALLAATGALCAQSNNRELFDQIDPTLEELSKITGLRVTERVERDFITRENLKKFLESRLEETVDPEELRVEELALKLFGFVPESYDLKKSTVDLLTEQAAAFYDYKKKKMFLMESAPAMAQRFVLVHELAHALADQHFNLEKFIQKGKSDDSATARMAVMEGQAQWLMYEVIASKSGQSLKKDSSMLRMMVNLSSSGLSEYPELSNAPLYIRESLLFPYTQGLMFQQAVVEKLGDGAFAEVFLHPPLSTQQVLHPESYFKKVKPSEPGLAEMPKHRDYSRVIEGALGELDIQILLRQFVDEEAAEKLAPAWRGGRYRVLERRKDKQPALVFSVDFDTEANARAFAELYRGKILPTKKRPMTAPRVEQKGTLVQVVEG